MGNASEGLIRVKNNFYGSILHNKYDRIQKRTHFTHDVDKREYNKRNNKKLLMYTLKNLKLCVYHLCKVTQNSSNPGLKLHHQIDDFSYETEY